VQPGFFVDTGRPSCRVGAVGLCPVSSMQGEIEGRSQGRLFWGFCLSASGGPRLRVPPSSRGDVIFFSLSGVLGRPATRGNVEGKVGW